MVEDDRAGIRRLPLFAGVGDATLDRLLAGSVIERHDDGAVLFRQDEMPGFLHILLHGRVCLLGTGADGRETVVEFLTGPDLFILAAALTDAPYLMTAQVIDQARLLKISAATLRGEVAGDARLAASLLAALSGQYRMMVRQIKELKLHSSTERLGRYLLALAGPQAGTASPPPAVTPPPAITLPPINLPPINLPYDKRLLAARLGMTPEHLSRAFAALRTVGVVTNKQTITVSDPDALARLCQWP